MGIKEAILKDLIEVGITTHARIFEITGSTNGGEYLSRLRKRHNIPCIMAINPRTHREYGIYHYKGKK